MNIKLIAKNLEFRRNIIIEGKTNSGKTTEIMFPLVDNIIYKNANLLIIDSKNEYKEKYEEILKSKNYNLVYLDFNDSNSNNKFNIFSTPIEYYKNNEKILCIQELRMISESLIKDYLGKDYTYARNTFIGIVLYLLYAGQFKINLVDIKQIVSKNGKELLDRILEEAKNDEEIYPYLENMYNEELRYKICVLINNLLSSYTINENITNMTNETNIDLDKEPLAIIVNADQNTKYANDIINIYIKQLYNYTKYKEKSLNIVLENYLDNEEYINLENMMLFSISNNIKFIISTNNLSEFTNKYGNFALKTSDVIKINNEAIEILQDPQRNTYDKEFTFFNVDLCIKEIKNKNGNIDEISLNKMNIFNEEPSLESTDLDKLLKKIETKIEEITSTKNEISMLIKEPVKIDEIDFEEYNDEPFSKIDFEDELTFEVKEEPEIKEEEKNESFEFNEISLDSLESKEQETEDEKETIDETQEFSDLLSLIDDKLIELDGNISDELEQANDNSSEDEKSDLFDFLEKE